MSAVPPLSEGQIAALAKVLGECGTGSDITHALSERGLVDQSGESTKWRRLHWVFLQSQKQYQCANHVLDFIKSFMAPVRFLGRSADFEERRQEVNTILAFSGLELGPDGEFRQCGTTRTLPEAERRLQMLQAKFHGRSMHPEVLKYCRAELLQDNYFHAVFEASKGLAQRIRELSGIHEDGAKLVDQVFAIDRPILAVNTLRTETEKSEHKGFAALLKGCFAAVRNPLAHEPRILWEGEDDAADYLSLISLLHRKLDSCVRTGF